MTSNADRCTIPENRHLPCGHCPHQICSDCEHCPCKCECAPVWTEKDYAAAARAAAIQAVKDHPSTTFMAPYESLADAVLTAATPLLRAQAFREATSAARRVRGWQYHPDTVQAVAIELERLEHQAGGCPEHGHGCEPDDHIEPPTVDGKAI